MIGFVAACCTTFSLLPQVIKVMRKNKFYFFGNVHFTSNRTFFGLYTV